MNFLKEYTLLGELGRGGFAKVYKVRHNELGYIRAIRVLNEPITDEHSRTYQKFLRECKVLLRLGNGSHSNIVHIYQPRLLENHALVEMDYVDGKDLAHYLADHGHFIPIDEVLQMVKEMSSALAYCHEDIYKFCMDREIDNLQDDPDDGSKVIVDEATRHLLIEKYKVIHNDIHSGNIIRRDDGNFVLLDFGLAITDGDDVRNSSRHENGAMEYKSPEKWEDDTILTEQSDIYSFGIVMYEYLAGRVPFPYDNSDSNRARNIFKLGEAHKSQTPPPIFNIRKSYFEENNPGKTYEKDYQDWLEEAIMKCLEKMPSKRFRNGKELYEFIYRHLDEQGIYSLRLENQSLAKEIKRIKEEAQIHIDKLEQRINEEVKISNVKLKHEEECFKKQKESLEKQIQLLSQENETLHNLVHIMTLEKQNSVSQPAPDIIQANDDHRTTERQDKTIDIDPKKPNPASTTKKYWLFFILAFVLIGGIWFIIHSVSSTKPSTSSSTTTRQQLIDDMSKNDRWQRDQIPQDLRGLLYDNIYSGNVAAFFTEVGDGKQVRDTLFSYGKAKINGNWTSMINDLQFIIKEGSTTERTDIKSQIREICNENKCVALDIIAQATATMRSGIADRKSQEIAKKRSDDVWYMKKNDVWQKNDLQTEEFLTLYDKIVSGDMDYLLTIARRIDEQPRDSTNGYWISICRELTQMEGNNDKLDEAKSELLRICGEGNQITLSAIRKSFHLINNPATPTPTPKPTPTPTPTPTTPNPKRPSSH